MNCHDSENLILAERDRELTKEQQTTLSSHLTSCPACRDFQANLHRALDSYRTTAGIIPVPDSNEAWRDLQAGLPRGKDKASRKRPLAPIIWYSAPLAAAAAIAFAFVLGRSPSPAAEFPLETARAEFVEAGDTNATTMVYVDKDSGWLVVWATDAGTQGSG